MMKNQYKDQLSSIVPSDRFKQDLKELMAAEYKAQANTFVNEAPKLNYSKYSRYIACAACLAMVIATVGVVSAFNSGFKMSKAYDSAEAEVQNMYALESDSNEAVFDTEATEDELPAEDDDVAVFDDSEDAYDELPAVESEEDDEAEVETEEAVYNEDISVEEPVSSDLPAKSAFAPENYDGEYFAEDYVYGQPGSGSIEALSLWQSADTDISYNTVCNSILSQLDSVGFVKFEVLDILSSEEADEIAGDGFSKENTMYRVELIYDYLTNDSADGETHIAAYGNELIQEQGFPTFEIGDIILACVDPNGDYIKVVDQLVYHVRRVGGLDIAYHLLYGNVDPGYTDMGVLDMERTMITSTSNNPAQYTNKAAIKELTRYIRRNFIKREFTLADLTDAELHEEIIEDEQPVIGDDVIIDDPIQEGGLSMDVSNVSFTVSNTDIYVGMDGSELSSFSMFSSARALADGTAEAVIGNNRIYFSGSRAFTGTVTGFDINDNGGILPMKFNGFGIGASWSSAINSLGIDITSEYNQVCDIDVVSGNDILYRITITVENGTVTKIVVTNKI